MTTDPVAVVRGLMEAMSRFHRGGPVEELVPLLSEDVVWHVPGDNAIASTYRGRSDVLGYFQRRREQAGQSLRFAERRVLVADDLVLHFAGGAAELKGQPREWETVGVYRIAGDANRRVLAGAVGPGAVRPSVALVLYSSDQLQEYRPTSVVHP